MDANKEFEIREPDRFEVWHRLGQSDKQTAKGHHFKPRMDANERE
jgi:hypothetical protein